MHSFKKFTSVVLSLILMLSIFNLDVLASTKTVVFKDKNLEKEVRLELNKSKGSITVNDMQKLKYLSECSNVADLTGLEYATNLEVLSIENAKVSSIKQIKNLKKLRSLYLDSSKKLVIKDIDNILVNLVNLTSLELKNIPIKSSTLSKLPYVNNYLLENNSLTDVSFMKNNKSKISIKFKTVGNQIADFTPLKNKSIDCLVILNNSKLNSKTLEGIDKVNNTNPTMTEFTLERTTNLEYLPSSTNIDIKDIKSIKINNKYYNEMMIIDNVNQLDLKSLLENWQDVKNANFLTKALIISNSDVVNYENINKVAGRPIDITFIVGTMDAYNKACKVATEINKNNNNIKIEIAVDASSLKFDYSKLDKNIYTKILDNVKNEKYGSLSAVNVVSYKQFGAADLDSLYDEDENKMYVNYGLSMVFGSEEIAEGFKIYDTDFNEIVNNGSDFTLDDNTKQLLKVQQVNEVAYKGITLMLTQDFKHIVGICRNNFNKMNYFVIDIK